MRCTEFYLCGVLYLNTRLQVCCTHTTLSRHRSSDSVMVLCEMCLALVGQDVSKRTGYSYGHSVHSCPLLKCKRSWKTNRVSNHTEQWSSCKALESEVPPLLKFWPVLSVSTCLGSNPFFPAAWTGSCFRLENYWVEGKGWGTGNL